MKPVPSVIQPPETATDDPRLGHFIQKKETAKKIRMVGFCSDQGVAINNGRTGAAAAPDEIRKMLFKLTPDPVNTDAFASACCGILDGGNFEANKTELESAQQALGKWTSAVLEKENIPIILGGGHETSFGHFLGYAGASKPVHILNWDAHADVRPLKNGEAHSGSPFYQALEHESRMCNGYIVAGLQRHSLSAAHLDYLQEKKATYYFAGELTKRVIGNIYDRLEGDTMVTMDMDALDQSVAPGVSAPCTNGLSLPLWLHAAYCAGKSPRVTSFDIVEMNPAFDRDTQTVRAAALTLWHFFRGLGKRV